MHCLGDNADLVPTMRQNDCNQILKYCIVQSYVKVLLSEPDKELYPWTHEVYYMASKIFSIKYGIFYIGLHIIENPFLLEKKYWRYGKQKVNKE